MAVAIIEHFGQGQDQQNQIEEVAVAGSIARTVTRVSLLEIKPPFEHENLHNGRCIQDYSSVGCDKEGRDGMVYIDTDV